MGRLSVQVRQDKVWTTAAATGTRIKREAIGGMVSASFRMTAPAALAQNLRADAQVHIASSSTCETVWTGRVASPGRKVENGTVTCDVTVDGDALLLDSSSMRRPYVVTDLGVWDRDDKGWSSAGASVQKTTVETTTPWEGLVLSIPEGTSIAPSASTRARARTYAHDGTGYPIGAFRCRHLEGATSDRWRVGAAVGYDDQTSSSRLWEAIANNDVAGDGTFARGVSANFPVGWTLASVFLETTAALDYSKADAKRWSGWSILTTVAQLKRRDGTDVNPMPQRDVLYASEVVEDLLGRDLLGKVSLDLHDSVVNESAVFPIDVLDYHDSHVSPRQVLDDLVRLNLGEFWYQVVPGSDGSGRPGLWWMPWPTGPRYVLPPGSADVTTVGSDEGLCNRVKARWSDGRGRPQEVTVTSTPDQYPDLADLGHWDEQAGWARIVEASPPLDLGKELGSAASAMQVAKAYAKQVATRPRAGTATVGVGDVLDLYSGCVVPPEEIQPGYLAWEPGVAESLRVTSTEYDDATELCVMQLDSPRSTVDQLIAKALRRRTR